jgi:hypothetical protein
MTCRGSRTIPGRFGGALAMALFAAVARGQEPTPAADETRARIERLEAKVKALEAAQQKPPADAGADSPAPADGDKKRTEPAPGEPPKLAVTWDGGGFRYRSADDAFGVHFGGRLMTDGVWWTQSPDLRLPAAQPPGSPLR